MQGSQIVRTELGSLRSSKMIPGILEPSLAQQRAQTFVKARGASRMPFSCREGDLEVVLSFFLTFTLLLLPSLLGGSGKYRFPSARKSFSKSLPNQMSFCTLAYEPTDQDGGPS